MRIERQPPNHIKQLRTGTVLCFSYPNYTKNTAETLLFPRYFWFALWAFMRQPLFLHIKINNSPGRTGKLFC